ncbi:hypothetical protein HYFRA_00003459 [Hymenoscyphus fraxineus]|uniref:Calcium-channel protein CCH1 n=1 Tax=Hymenoscyphus fraxineus TaxID=746836 RepID=A0A9N9PNA3_9HELO|nr:hypothetical protein HYFRA_00003459 [Hymenoscyphus fraxineus]
MPPPNSQDPSHPATPPQSIPLQNLEPPPESVDLADGHRQHTRGRSILSGISSRPSSGGYERVQTGSPSRTERPARASRPLVSTQSSRIHQNTNYNEEPETSSSPVDTTSFAAAMAFTGLSVPDISISQVPQPSPAPSTFSPFGTSYPMDDMDRISPYGDASDEYFSNQSSYFHTEASDSIPLTDASHLQPISGAPGHIRSDSFHSVNFDSTDQVRRRSNRNSDGIGPTDQGLSPRPGRSRGQSYGASLAPDAQSHSRSRSPSTTSGAFLRAGSIVRAMSQRVVNISGEAELIESAARRESAAKAYPIQRQPSLSTLASLSDEEEIRFQPKRKKDPLAAGPNPQAQLPTAPVEKAMRLFVKGERQESLEEEIEKPPNPLRGRSLGIFTSDSKVRNWLCDVLVYPLTEPIILILIMVQTVLLAVESSRSVFDDGHGRPDRWGRSHIDLAIFGLFVIFTLELIARIIVSGFILNAPEYSSTKGKVGAKAIILDKYRSVFKPQRESSTRGTRPSPSLSAPTIVRSFTAIQGDKVRTVEQAQRLQLARRAFLRHGFNRLDFVAVCAYWVSFVLSITGVESGRHMYVFRMLSCLRILRLLALTHGTAVILRSLKKAAPLLVNVSFLIGFFWLLFAVIGVQSFKSSLDRQCVWVDPTDPFNSSSTAWVDSGQYCGGQFNSLGEHEVWRYGPDNSSVALNATRPSDSAIKGYLCPQGSYCIELDHKTLPFNGTISFDNIFQSLELVFVIMTANTYTDLMYYTMDSDYLATALFFAGGIMIMMLWLLNLLIAVITSSFQVIREEGKASAFAARVKDMLPTNAPVPSPRFNQFKQLFDKTKWFWLLCIAYDIVVQASRSSTMPPSRGRFIDNSEVVVTFILFIEIVLRFAVDWRGFTRNKLNWLDFGLAVITMVILIPPIHTSGTPYAWLTIFQLVRVYRIIIAVPVTRKLITLVLGNASGIGNLMLFVFLITFLISIFAVQLFRGELPAQDDSGNDIIASFFTIYNAFLAMYQILSSENWTSILYSVTGAGRSRDNAWIGAAFLIGWFILANFILVNMFIAVIQENFDVSEDEKRMHQVKAFLNRKELGSNSSNLSLSAIFRFGKSRKTKDPLDYGPATMEMLLKDKVVKDFLDDEIHAAEQTPAVPDTLPTDENAPSTAGFFTRLRSKFKNRIWNREPNPFYSNIQFSNRADDTMDARTLAKEAVSATSQRKKAQREFLARHPTYNNALFILTPTNPIRHFCQRIVGPGRGGERIDGVEPNRVVWYAFSAFIYAAIVAMVLLACVTTPLYQKEYFQTHAFSVKNWFVWVDMSFAVVFSVEALIKVLADGLFWTPNAYFRSSWGMIDGVVLITFWINVITSLMGDGEVSRAVGAFKALRALRLLNVSDSARETFHSLIVVGFSKFFSAAFVSLSLLIPFAVYGVNLFNGRLVSCNDSNFPGGSNLNDCFGEYQANPFSENWPIIQPRVAANQFFDFDDFGSSLFILFQIVSQEGWVDVMSAAESIVGPGLQPQFQTSQGNAVFFVIFNILATVFILTLFISVFMRNYTEQTGVAFLTAEQRSWLELRKLLKQVSPSKRPSTTATSNWKDWCYKRAVRKHGRWQRCVTIALVLHLIILLVEYYPEPAGWDTARNFVFLAFTAFYLANIMVRIIGLSWSRFRRSAWDVFSIVAVVGTLISTIVLLMDIKKQLYIQLHKLFLVSIVLLLIPRNDALDQLFKTAAASLTNIGNLLATWFVFFLVFAIAMTQTFGLTRFGSQETGNLNFRTVPKALILLFKMSTGEGWNEIMEDFAGVEPPFCHKDTTSFFNSDCGSTNWARALFIAWNILSMYIFTSLFVSLIYESFSYVYQHSSGLGKVSREEIRRFKQAWATLDPEGTGFITKEQFPRLLGELSGVFEMRIYDHEHSVRSILEDIQAQPSSGRISAMAGSAGSSGVNLKALNKRLAMIDHQKVRIARARYNLFYEEVMVSAEVDVGISFTTVLMILAHYNVISDSKSLKLEEFLRRRARLQRVEEEIRRRIVLGFFDTMYWSRRFRKHLEKKRSGRMTDVPQLGPEVYVDDEEEIARKAKAKAHASSRLSPMDIVDPRSSFITHGLDGAYRHRMTESFSSAGGPLSPSSPWPASPGRSPQRSPQLSPHRPTNSNFSFEENQQQLSAPNSAPSSRRGSAVSAENVLEVLETSAWGESIRRSFTTRRPDRREGT